MGSFSRPPSDGGQSALGRLARLVGLALRAPGAALLVRDADGEEEALAGAYGLPAGWDPPMRFDRTSRERLAADPMLASTLESPIRNPDGRVLGALAAYDHRPRSWSAHDQALVAELAALAAGELTRDLDERSVEPAPEAWRADPSPWPNPAPTGAPLGRTSQGENLRDPSSERSPGESADERESAAWARTPSEADQPPPLALRSWSGAQLLDSILASMEELLVVVAPDRRVVLANDAARRLFGQSADPLGWTGESGVFLGDQVTRCPVEDWPPHQALSGARVFEMELLIRPPGDSDGRWLSCAASPLVDPEGTITGAVCLGRDVTTTREATLDLIEQSRRVGLLQRVAVTANDQLSVDQALRQILALITEDTGWPLAHVYLPKGDLLVPSELWVSRDLPRYQPFVDFTMRTPMAVGEGVLGRAAQLGRVVWRSRLAQDDDYLFLRREAARRCGLGTGIFLPVSIGTELVAVVEFFAVGNEPQREGFVELLENIGGLLGRVFERERTRGALESYAEQVRALSLVDDLTGLYNRRGFLTLAEQQVRIGHRTQMRHHLVFADLDGMKAINDRLGHAAGDDALRDAALVLRKTFRESDVLARLGGDEFVAFAADTLPEAGERVLDRLRAAVEAQNGEGKRPYALEISFGYTLYDPRNPRSLEDLLGEADQLMYEEKKRHKAARGE